MITSTSNSQVKQVGALAKKAKARKESGLFLVEGRRCFPSCPESGWTGFMCRRAFKAAGERAEALLSGCRYETVTDEVMRAMSTPRRPRGFWLCAASFPTSFPIFWGETRCIWLFWRPSKIREIWEPF